jgi:CheY-like chemotaxis protein
MVEAARRVDEMKLIRSEIPVDQLIPQRIGPPATVQDVAAAGTAAKEILALVDGRHSIDQIVQISNYPKFTVLSTLYELKHRGLVSLEAATPGELTETRPSGPSVLLIAQQDGSRTETVAQLQGGGYTVVEVDAWPDAEAWVDTAAAVVIDLSPDVDGALAICDRLREDTKKSFIVLTEAAAQMEALQSGARYVLLKPVPGQVLLERIAQLRGT